MEGLDGAEDEAEVLPSTSKKKKLKPRMVKTGEFIKQY